ncbi:Fic/DOC family protein [Serratia fonticola]|uniref:Fic/DOC family protein n=1 Tax=Serratia fonticola TaxID=47917 RepID=UPI002179BAA6|nr:Fic family protein [Serratia fonticola]CAI0864144.1 Probable adenosine monophosphate-protein transferase fic [Serratia fonticola]CAI0924697.1 Probable adenosine monophosphate-protein transferase fic [Serratia fonticola]CAI1793670.1 Probable adenosine monophosphate-protein transferase fic [Serratia fonticola]CAI1889149.1 Probable adenosine monophosphate-protein transferase fic [Serratia fonticola]CAI1941944.1 Probable adenosine monophosphate-protein transferase fic [Serratia fonticola]
MSRYELNSAEERYQPGSGDSVLANKLGITAVDEMEALESGLLLMMYEQLFIEGPLPETLAFDHISGWHRQWLGNVYDWAGRLRSANLTKDGFQFAAADRIPLLLAGFEKQFLSRSGELKLLSRPELVSYLAECHVEFILIHPFREGNGRLSRLLFDVLAVQAGGGLLDYSLWDEHKAFYFKAIQAGVSGNYSPMMQLVSDILPD